MQVGPHRGDSFSHREETKEAVSLFILQYKMPWPKVSKPSVQLTEVAALAKRFQELALSHCCPGKDIVCDFFNKTRLVWRLLRPPRSAADDDGASVQIGRS